MEQTNAQTIDEIKRSINSKAAEIAGTSGDGAAPDSDNSNGSQRQGFLSNLFSSSDETSEKGQTKTRGRPKKRAAEKETKERRIETGKAIGAITIPILQGIKSLKYGSSPKAEIAADKETEYFHAVGHVVETRLGDLTAYNDLIHLASATVLLLEPVISDSLILLSLTLKNRIAKTRKKMEDV
tara:strand:- start:9473 stop:10021 length:549 start_codon:yes stop_codon:yes gene_type:complete